MKTIVPRIIVSMCIMFVASAMALPMAGCFGNGARNAALPVMAAKSTEIVQEARNGAAILTTGGEASLAAVEAFSAAVQSKDRARITAEAWPQWPTVRLCAEAWIVHEKQANHLGPNGADSLNERLSRYEYDLRLIAVGR